jgi:EthD domain
MASKSQSGNDTPKSGGGSSKSSSSPLSTRRGNEDPVDVHDSEVTSETGDLGYDKNTRASYRTDPWAESHRSRIDGGAIDMLKVLAFLTKRKGLGTGELIDYYENHHVPLVLSLVSATPSVYKRNYLVRGDEFNRENEALDFDVITELVFSDRAGFVKWIEELSVDEIAADEEQFLDRSRTRAYVIEERVTAN